MRRWRGKLKWRPEVYSTGTENTSPESAEKTRWWSAELERVRSEKGGDPDGSDGQDEKNLWRKPSDRSPLYSPDRHDCLGGGLLVVHSPGHGRLRVPGESGRHTWLLLGYREFCWD